MVTPTAGVLLCNLAGGEGSSSRGRCTSPHARTPRGGPQASGLNPGGLFSCYLSGGPRLGTVPLWQRWVWFVLGFVLLSPVVLYLAGYILSRFEQ